MIFPRKVKSQLVTNGKGPNREIPIKVRISLTTRIERQNHKFLPWD